METMKSSLKVILGLAFCSFSLTSLAARPPNPQIDPSRTGREVQGYTVPMIPTAKMVVAPKAEKVSAPLKHGKEATFQLNKIVIDGATEYTPGTLQKLYQPYLGKKVTFSDLQDIAYAITNQYREEGYILTKAIIPAQKITNGVVHIRIIEGFIDRVTVEGTIPDGTRRVVEGYGQKIKELWLLRSAFSMQRLERYILLANDLPGVDVKTVLSQSKTKLGGTDLTFIVTQKRIAGGVNYNNYGTRYLGPQQLGANFQVNSVLGTADAFSANFVKTPTKPDMRTFGAYYVRPIGFNGMTMNANIILTKTKPNIRTTAGIPINFEGDSKEILVGIDYPWIRTRLANLTLQAKFDWLNTNLNMDLPSLFYDRIRSLRLGGTYERVDHWNGVNTIGLVASHGFLIGGAKNDSGHLSRNGAKSNYTKVDLDLSRWQSLRNQWSFLISLNTQYTPQSLLSSEEIGFGGRSFGRGYDPSEISGDKGIVGKFELRKDTNTNFRFLKTIQYYGFYDAGTVWNNKGNTSDQASHISGTSVGLGTRIGFNQYLSGEAEIAKPLTLKVSSLETAGRNPKAARVFFSLVGSF